MKRHLLRPGRRASEAGILLCVAFFICSMGCKGKQPVSSPDAPPPPDAPSYVQLASAHNQRVAKLYRFYANGVIELRWRDDKGRHFEQGNLELWIRQPLHSALRVEKVGTVFLWLGSDQHRYWLFDLLTDDKVLHVGRHDQPGGLNQSALAIKPASLLDLMGIAAIAPEPAKESLATATFSNEHDAWMIETIGAGGPLRMYFDRQSLLPSRIESLAKLSDAPPALVSALKRYNSVTQQGMSVLAFPKMAHQIDVVIAEQVGDAATGTPTFTGEVKIVFDRATGIVDEGTLGRVFDLDRLTQVLRPTRVQEQ